MRTQVREVDLEMNRSQLLKELAMYRRLLREKEEESKKDKAGLKTKDAMIEHLRSQLKRQATSSLPPPKRPRS